MTFFGPLQKWPRGTVEKWGPWFLYSLFVAILFWEVGQAKPSPTHTVQPPHGSPLMALMYLHMASVSAVHPLHCTGAVGPAQHGRPLVVAAPAHHGGRCELQRGLRAPALVPLPLPHRRNECE
jgi:hypothetical protein